MTSCASVPVAMGFASADNNGHLKGMSAFENWKKMDKLVITPALLNTRSWVHISGKSLSFGIKT